MLPSLVDCEALLDELESPSVEDMLVLAEVTELAMSSPVESPLVEPIAIVVPVTDSGSVKQAHSPNKATQAILRCINRR